MRTEIPTKVSILFLKGLPASGKSTFAKDFCKQNPEFIRLNKDDLREFFGNPPFSREFEDQVLQIQRLMVTTALSIGKSVIIDDTNFAPKHQKYYEKIASDGHFEFVVQFFDTPVEVCIERDLAREKSVGKDVILKMYETYLKT
jgi:predicted kinase